MQLDRFNVCQLADSRARTLLKTDFDVASSYSWAMSHNTSTITPLAIPPPWWCKSLGELGRRGWRLGRVSTVHAGEFASTTLSPTLPSARVRHTRIADGRSQLNGYVTRRHRTILEKCYCRALARDLVPRFSDLRTDRRRYLRC